MRQPDWIGFTIIILCHISNLENRTTTSYTLMHLDEMMNMSPIP
jgi:hypothetical protein